MDSHRSNSSLQELHFALALGQQDLIQHNFAPVSAGLLASQNFHQQQITSANLKSFSNLQAVNGSLIPQVAQQQNLVAAQGGLHQQQGFRSIFAPLRRRQDQSPSMERVIATSQIANRGPSQPPTQQPKLLSSHRFPQLPIPASYFQTRQSLPPNSQSTENFQELSPRVTPQFPQKRKLFVNEQSQPGANTASGHVQKRQASSANKIYQNDPENVGSLLFQEHLKAMQSQAVAPTGKPQPGPGLLLPQEGVASCSQLPQAKMPPHQYVPGPKVDFPNNAKSATMLDEFNSLVDYRNSSRQNENFADTFVQLNSLLDSNKLHATNSAGKEQPILVEDDVETRLREAILWETNPVLFHPRFPQLRQNVALLATPRSELSPEAPNSANDVPMIALLLHEFIRTLPPKSPCPFKTEIFMESNLFTKPKSILKTIPVQESYMDGNEGWTEKSLVFEKSKMYRKYCVLSGYQKLELLKGKSVIEGFCTVWTRKFPVGWTVDDDELEANPADDPLRKKQRIDGIDSSGSRNPEDPKGIVWQYSAMVTVQGRPDKIKCAVPKNVLAIGGVTYDVEPSWDDVVKALKEEIRQREIRLGWTLSRYFPAEGRIPQDSNSRSAVRQQKPKPIPKKWQEAVARARMPLNTQGQQCAQPFNAGCVVQVPQNKIEQPGQSFNSPCFMLEAQNQRFPDLKLGEAFQQLHQSPPRPAGVEGGRPCSGFERGNEKSPSRCRARPRALGHPFDNAVAKYHLAAMQHQISPATTSHDQVLRPAGPYQSPYDAQYQKRAPLRQPPPMIHPYVENVNSGAQYSPFLYGRSSDIAGSDSNSSQALLAQAEQFFGYSNGGPGRVGQNNSQLSDHIHPPQSS